MDKICSSQRSRKIHGRRGSQGPRRGHRRDRVYHCPCVEARAPETYGGAETGLPRKGHSSNLAQLAPPKPLGRRRCEEPGAESKDRATVQEMPRTDSTNSQILPQSQRVEPGFRLLAPGIVRREVPLSQSSPASPLLQLPPRPWPQQLGSTWKFAASPRLHGFTRQRTFWKAACL